MSVVKIGLTTRNVLSPTYDIPMVASPRSYTEALIKAGAIPVLIPLNLPAAYFEQVLDSVDGMIFTGGGDLAVSHFNGQPHEKVGNVDPERDQMELALVKRVIEAKMPFLGICRGVQTLNVALGGTLYTHIPDQLEGAVEHTFFPGYPWDHIAHDVEIVPESALAKIVSGTQLAVNSLHHQGVARVGEGLEVTAKAPDGLVEALELAGYPFGLAVQWHPEWMPESEQSQAIFGAFIEAARENRGK